MGFGRWGLRDASKNRTTTTNPLTGGYTSVQYTLPNGDNIGVINYPGALGPTSGNVLVRINLTQNTYSSAYTSSYPAVYKIDKIIAPNGNIFIYGASNDAISGSPSANARVFLFQESGVGLTRVASSPFDTGRPYFVPSVTISGESYIFTVPISADVSGYRINWTRSGNTITNFSGVSPISFTSFTRNTESIYYASTWYDTSGGTPAPHVLFGFNSSNKLVLATLSSTIFTQRNTRTVTGNVQWITNDRLNYFVVTNGGYAYKYTVSGTSPSYTLTQDAGGQVSSSDNNLIYAIVAGNLFCCTSTNGHLYIVNKTSTFSSSTFQKYQIRNGTNATVNLRGLLYDSANNYLLIPDSASKIYYFNLNTMQQESWAQL